MEFVVRKNDLLRELQLFQGIVERKNTIPILANVLMEAKDGDLRFLATDLEVGLRSKCPASISKGGSLTLPAKKFYEIVRSLPETDIRVAEEKNGVPESGGQPTATLPRNALKEML
jgi:DNA polymerase III subunit beta